jgi:hypothetical protein
VARSIGGSNELCSNGNESPSTSSEASDIQLVLDRNIYKKTVTDRTTKENGGRQGVQILSCCSYCERRLDKGEIPSSPGSTIIFKLLTINNNA